MKIPEPIIDPTTIMVESNKPRPRTNPDDSVSVTIGSITSVDVGSDIAPLLFYPPGNANLPIGGFGRRQSGDWRSRAPAYAFRDFTVAATSRYCRARSPGFAAQIRSRTTASESAPAS